MNKHYRYLNFALAFWGFALASWCLDARLYTFFAVLLTLLSFCLHAAKNQVNAMFGKSKNSPTSPLPTPTMDAAPPPDVEKASVRDEKQNTVIASGTLFNGNIVAAGQVHIFGTVTGDIDAKESVIKVMRSGVIEGNIYCRELFIDGTINGQCHSESINIEEHGAVNGLLAYGTLTIKKGGTFSGQAQLIAPVEKAMPGKKKMAE